MLEEIEPLAEEGFAVHLLRPRSKIPVLDGWSEAPVLTFSELKRRYRDGNNVGVRLGKPSYVDGLYLHVIDLDIRVADSADEADNALKRLLKGVKISLLPRVQSGSRGESRHYYFLCADPFPSRKIAHSGVKFTDSKGKQHWTWEIEVFGTGKQVALPPSVHPDTGKTYIWLREPDFDLGIPEIDADLIGDLVFAQDSADEEQDNDAPLNMSFGEAEAALNSLHKMADDHDTWRDVGMAMKHEFGENGWGLFDEWSKAGKGYDKAGNRAQWKAFKNDRSRKITMRSILMKAREADNLASLESDLEELDKDDAPESPSETAGKPRKAKKGDPNLTLLEDSRIAAPDFPLDIFGKQLAEEIRRHAIGAAAPDDFVAAAILSGASSVIGNTTRVEVRSGFVQAPILWCQIIGSPSSNKSPALRVVSSVLHKIEARFEPIYIQNLERWKRKKEVADMKAKEWRGKIKGMLAEDKEVEHEMPADCVAPPEPHQRLFIMNDMTIEAFMHAQARNPRGFMVLRDELAGWIGNMERYSAESDRAAWLESYDGGRYKIERVKFEGKVLSIPHMYAPVLGGIQPERLLEITAQSTVDDGLQARFLPFWPEKPIRKLALDATDDRWLMEMFDKLSTIPMSKDANDKPVPFVAKFTREALLAFAKWSDHRKTAEQHAHTRINGMFGKAEGQIARIALVLEYLWWAAVPDFDDDDDGDAPARVSREAVEAAIRFREEYLKPMQQRVFASAIEPLEMTNARHIAKWIVDNEVESFNASRMRREAGIKGINSRTDSEVIDSASPLSFHSAGFCRRRRKAEGEGDRQNLTPSMIACGSC